MDEHNKVNEESRLHRDNYIQLCRAPTESSWGRRCRGLFMPGQNHNNISTICVRARERHIFMKTSVTTAQDVSAFARV